MTNKQIWETCKVPIIISIVISVFLVISFIWAFAMSEPVDCNANSTEFKVHDAFVYTGTIVDSKTGVNYIVVDNDKSIDICPRYNSDGTLYVSK